MASARMSFLSIEPLLEDLGLIRLDGMDWVIVGYLRLRTLVRDEDRISEMGPSRELDNSGPHEDEEVRGGGNG